MGVNIILQRVDGTEHPKWDVVRQGLDRDFADMIGQLPHIESTDVEGDALLRPSNFVVWREVLGDSGLPERYTQLLAILEEDTGYWIHLSR